MLAAVPDLVKGLRLDPRTVFVPVLSSAETLASDASVLWRLARHCAGTAGAGFEGGAVEKDAHPPLHGARSAARRQEMRPHTRRG